ncbi:MAG: hypothetical protein KDJ78_03485 [Rhodobacteraceae bacterium]|nr:hypothetical protein [Paracoccaceae bacterium]
MAPVVAAPKQRNTEGEKQALREGRIPEDWARRPAKLRQKEFANGTPMVRETLVNDARWTVKQARRIPASTGHRGSPSRSRSAATRTMSASIAGPG